LIAAGIVVGVAVEVAHGCCQGRPNVHLNKAHQRGQDACGKGGKNGRKCRAEGVGWVGGGLESRPAP
jgi:hypothetical protein